MIMLMRSRQLLLSTGVGLLTGLSIVACSRQADRASADSRPPIPVTAAAVAMTDLDETFEAGGVVQAQTTATLTSRILAPVMAVRVKPGDRVRSGQVLITLDGRDLRARARSAVAGARGAEQRAQASEADVRAAEASLALAKATYDRIAALQAKRSATSQELDEATASLRAAEARLAATSARLQEATAAIASSQADSDAASTIESFTEIASPFDGVVTEKMVEPGNMASPGTPLLRVEDTRRFRLDVRIDESRAGTLTVGSMVPVVAVDSPADTARTLNGTISEIARAIDSDARAFLVKIALPTTDDLRSGMFGRARFTGRKRRSLTVPSDAVVRRGQVTSVFVVDNGVARLRLVNVADGEVRAGLKEGERVIVKPSPDVVDGRRVTEARP
jgi:RND family efflux transporter MFP subunit